MITRQIDIKIDRIKVRVEVKFRVCRMMAKSMRKMLHKAKWSPVAEHDREIIQVELTAGAFVGDQSD